MANPRVPQAQPATFAAQDAAGAAIDLGKFPAAVSGVAYTLDNAAFVATQSGNDVSVASVDPAGAGGTVNVTVNCSNVNGLPLTASVAMTFDAFVPVAQTVSLTLGPVAVA